MTHALPRVRLHDRGREGSRKRRGVKARPRLAEHRRDELHAVTLHQIAILARTKVRIHHVKIDERDRSALIRDVNGHV